MQNFKGPVLGSAVMTQALGYPTHRLSLMVLESRGIWTEASARALRRPSVAVQVFRVECGYMRFPEDHREVTELEVPQK